MCEQLFFPTLQDHGFRFDLAFGRCPKNFVFFADRRQWVVAEKHLPKLLIDLMLMFHFHFYISIHPENMRKAIKNPYIFRGYRGSIHGRSQQ